ncbi:glutaredoxin 2 [Protopterus annectens]|uniref:glutaredoxin 2 n=1 Tax=Protopterus annectens TaxID=7888 RepID=UPI001CF9F865|nr:glutaredoxin 2 [Protopterus annectens]
MGNIRSSTSRPLTDAAALQLITDIVSQNCVVIFSKTSCPYCVTAKNLFHEIGTNYKVLELDQHENGRQLQTVLGEMTGAHTVPRVFVNGSCIGGCTETQQLHRQGKLVPLVKECS